MNPASNAEENLPADEFHYEDVEFDIDSFKDQLGIREIFESLSTLSRMVSGQHLQLACPTRVLILRLLRP